MTTTDRPAMTVRGIAHFASMNTIRDFATMAEAEAWLRARLDAGCDAYLIPAPPPSDRMVDRGAVRSEAR